MSNEQPDNAPHVRPCAIMFSIPTGTKASNYSASEQVDWIRREMPPCPCPVCRVMIGDVHAFCRHRFDAIPRIGGIGLCANCYVLLELGEGGWIVAAESRLPEIADMISYVNSNRIPWAYRPPIEIPLESV